MATLISSLHTPAPGMIRAILGDFDASTYSADAIKATVQMVVMTGGLPGYALSTDRLSIEPSIATPKDWGLLFYRTAMVFAAPQSAGYSFRTRAVSEKFGDNKLFIAELHRVLYEIENPAMLGSWSDFSTWLTGMTGLNVFQSLTRMETHAPVATASIGIAGLTISGGGS